MNSNKLEVLVSTVNKDCKKLYEDMKICSNAVIVNQANTVNKFMYKINDNILKVYEYDERGIGKSRNKGLINIEAEICLIADDDLTYVDNYEKIVLDAFKKLPDADLIIFDIVLYNVSKEITKERPIKKIQKLNSFNSMRYGACRMAVKMDSVRSNNVWFSLLFGGGAKYSAGEDSLFLRECFSKNMKVYAYPKVIAYVDESNSSWFTGLNEKYFKDKGAFLGAAFPKISNLLAMYYALRLQKSCKGKYSIKDSYKYMKNGINEIKNK